MTQRKGESGGHRWWNRGATNREKDREREREREKECVAGYTRHVRRTPFSDRVKEVDSLLDLQSIDWSVAQGLSRCAVIKTSLDPMDGAADCISEKPGNRQQRVNNLR